MLDVSISTAASKWLSQHIFTGTSPLPTCPWNLCQCFCSPASSCTAGWSFLVRGFMGLFSAPWPRKVSQRLVWAFLGPAELTPCFSGLVCTCLGSPGLPSVSRGLCALVLAHQPALYIVGLVCSFCSLGLPTVPLRVVYAGEVCMFPLSICFCTPGLLFALQGFCGLLWLPRACPLVGTTVMSSLSAEKFRFLCLLSSKSRLCPVFQDSSAPLWVRLWGSFPVQGTLPASGFPTSLGTSSHLEVLYLFPFCLYPLSYLIPGSLACPLEAWGLLLWSRGCFVRVVPYLDEFFMYSWGGWWYPHLTSLPSSSTWTEQICR